MTKMQAICWGATLVLGLAAWPGCRTPESRGQAGSMDSATLSAWLAEFAARGPNVRLAGARFLMVPNSNPDGRDRNRRVNAAKANLSTDFTMLAQPESQALAWLLTRWRPDVVLDLHESAIWKKQTLGAQGYMLDFEAQFETAKG